MLHWKCGIIDRFLTNTKTIYIVNKVTRLDTIERYSYRGGWINGLTFLICIYGPDRDIVENAESMESVIKKFRSRGMPVDEISKWTM